MSIEGTILFIAVCVTIAYFAGWFTAYRYYIKKYRIMIDKYEKTLISVTKLTDLIRSAFPEIDDQFNKEEGPGEI